MTTERFEIENLRREDQEEKPESVENRLRGLEDLIRRGDTVGIWKQEACGHEILTAEEERELTRRCFEGREAEQEKSRGDCGKEREARLQHLVSEGERARDKLVNANQRMVMSIATKYKGRGLPFSDLIQEGSIGLMTAIDRYDPEKGTRLSTYSYYWIEQTITRALGNIGKTIRMPVHAYEEALKLVKTRNSMYQDLDREPTEEELAKEIGMRRDKVSLLLGSIDDPLSLDVLVNEGEDTTFEEMIRDDGHKTVEEQVKEGMLKESIGDLLATLTPREAKILELRFGLNGSGAETLEEIGQKFGLTRERIRQIEKKALRRLRHPRRARKLRDFYED